MGTPISEIAQKILCPPGHGVYTINTAKERKEKLNNILFPEEIEAWYHCFYAKTLDFNSAQHRILKDSGREFFMAAEKAIHASPNEFNLVSKVLGTEFKRTAKTLFLPIRIALTACSHGPDLQAIIRLLGKEKTQRRFQAVIQRISE